MTAPEHFTGHMALYTPVGEAGLDQAIGMVEKAVAHASENGYRMLLVDVLQLHGMALPTILQRYQMVRRWSKAATFGLRVAIVCEEKYIHEQRVGVVLARSHGFTAQPFTSRSDALVWLVL